LLGAAALLGALMLGVRAGYPRYFEWRALRRRPLGSDGVVEGAGEITLTRTGAPGVLLLHGGGDTPQVLAELAAFLYGDGFTVRVPLLSHHGRRLAELGSASAANWRDDARREYEALRRAHDWVAVVGLSMGGALAIELAAESPELPVLVLLAPYIAMPPSIQRAAAFSRYWGWAVPYFSSRGGASVHDKSAAAKGRGHGVFTPAALRALSEVVDGAARALPRVQAPTLVIQSRQDNRISMAAAEAAYARLGSSDKRFEWVEGAGHVITVDYGRERVFEMTRAWLRAHLESRGVRPPG
jgi:carboxylesterase